MNRCSLQNNTDINHALGDYDLESHKLSYKELFPRIYNYCKSLGFEMNKIMPSQAFCSDENQGYPIILMAKHLIMAA
jgi:1,4-alpha-glucan branching enzyme